MHPVDNIQVYQKHWVSSREEQTQEETGANVIKATTQIKRAANGKIHHTEIKCLLVQYTASLAACKLKEKRWQNPTWPTQWEYTEGKKRHVLRDLLTGYYSLFFDLLWEHVLHPSILQTLKAIGPDRSKGEDLWAFISDNINLCLRFRLLPLAAVAVWDQGICNGWMRNCLADHLHDYTHTYTLSILILLYKSPNNQSTGTALQKFITIILILI